MPWILAEVPQLMATFFTSGTHFSDHRTINVHRRPFASVGEMDEVLVRNWNAVIEPEDDVWHLGDFARTGSQRPFSLDCIVKSIRSGATTTPMKPPALLAGLPCTTTSS